MPTPRIRTLVVEDDPVSRQLLRTVLEGRGHEVEACADAEAAWRVAGRRPFSLAVLDMHLPGMDGADLCRKLHKLPWADALVTVFVTGSSRPEDLRRAVEAGADDYVLKPLVEADLPVRFALAERKIYFLRDRKTTEQGLLRDALHDPVTDLPNRALFDERLQRTARRASRVNQEAGPTDRYMYAVLYLNLDGFGAVNARLGYEGGDQVLAQVARRLEQCVRGADTVARFGGDEFIILLDDLKDVSDPTRVARRIEQALLRPIVTDNGEARLSASGGIALSLAQHSDAAQLVDEARMALLRAKQDTQGSWQTFDAVVHARALARLELESRLRQAVATNEMTVAFQPMATLEANQVVGFEALVRWNHPERGVVSPQEFIGVAEDTGVILSLGQFVLEEVIRQYRDWKALLPPDRRFFLSVNISGRQFVDRSAADRLLQTIEEADLPPGALHAEITETALMRNLDQVGGMLTRLSEAGVRIHVDDFGTGYSSLSYLCRLPLAGLKIDQTFVDQMNHSRENMEVVRTIVRLGTNLDLEVIAEGVETEGQCDALNAMGCHLAQGYLYGRPFPPDEAFRRVGLGSAAG